MLNTFVKLHYSTIELFLNYFGLQTHMIKDMYLLICVNLFSPHPLSEMKSQQPFSSMTNKYSHDDHYTANVL